jgi:hypothetical protein
MSVVAVRGRWREHGLERYRQVDPRGVDKP